MLTCLLRVLYILLTVVAVVDVTQQLVVVTIATHGTKGSDRKEVPAAIRRYDIGGSDFSARRNVNLAFEARRYMTSFPILGPLLIALVSYARCRGCSRCMCATVETRRCCHQEVLLVNNRVQVSPMLPALRVSECHSRSCASGRRPSPSPVFHRPRRRLLSHTRSHTSLILSNRSSSTRYHRPGQSNASLDVASDLNASLQASSCFVSVALYRLTCLRHPDIYAYSLENTEGDNGSPCPSTELWLSL